MNRLGLLLLIVSSHVLPQTRQPEPSFAIQSDPETIYRGLRTKSPIPLADCKLLDLWECQPGNPERIADISLRWVNLDEDPELEAILVSAAPAEWTYVTAIFDRVKNWRLVGSSFCHRNCRANTFVSVHKLTDDSPALLFLNRDLGGSGGYHLALEGYQLRAGRLWPVVEFTQQAEAETTVLLFAANDVVYAKEKSLVLHHREYRVETKAWKETCTVKRWDAKAFRFVEAPGQQPHFCDAKTGRPIKNRSWLTSLPASPLY